MINLKTSLVLYRQTNINIKRDLVVRMETNPKHSKDNILESLLPKSKNNKTRLKLMQQVASE
jgi:hypothetical protein